MKRYYVEIKDTATKVFFDCAIERTEFILTNKLLNSMKLYETDEKGGLANVKG